MRPFCIGCCPGCSACSAGMCCSRLHLAAAAEDSVPSTLDAAVALSAVALLLLLLLLLLLPLLSETTAAGADPALLAATNVAAWPKCEGWKLSKQAWLRSTK